MRFTVLSRCGKYHENNWRLFISHILYIVDYTSPSRNRDADDLDIHLWFFLEGLGILNLMHNI